MKQRKLGICEYAKHRGVKLKDVKKAINDEIINTAVLSGRNDRKIILVDIADELWNDHLGIVPDPVLKDKGKLIQDYKPGKGFREGSMMVGGEHNETYSKARTAKEVMSAKIAQIKYDQLAGSLVEVDDVKKAVKEIGRNLRDSLLNIPNKLSPILASENDIQKIKLILESEIKSGLENLSRGDFDFIGRDNVL